MFSRRRRHGGGYVIKTGEMGSITTFKNNLYNYGIAPGVHRNNLKCIALGVKAYDNSITIDFRNLYDDDYTQSYLDGTYIINGTIFINDNSGIFQKIEFNLPLDGDIDNWYINNHGKFNIPSGLNVSISSVSLYYCFHKNTSGSDNIYIFSRVYNLNSNTTCRDTKYITKTLPFYCNVEYRTNSVSPSNTTHASRYVIYQDQCFGYDTWNLNVVPTAASQSCGTNVLIWYRNCYPTE